MWCENILQASCWPLIPPACVSCLEPHLSGNSQHNKLQRQSLLQLRGDVIRFHWLPCILSQADNHWQAIVQYPARVGSFHRGRSPTMKRLSLRLSTFPWFNSDIVAHHVSSHSSSCMYACEKAYTYTYIFTYIHMHMCTFTHLYIHTSKQNLQLYIYTYKHMYTCTYIHTLHYISLHYITLYYIGLHYITCIHVNIYMYTYICIHIYVYIFANIYVYTPILTYTQVYISMYIL